MENGAKQFASNRWAYALAEMADTVFVALTKEGLDEDTAGKYTNIALGALTNDFGGSSLYIPKQDSTLRWWRDCEIYRQIGKAPIQQLARQYGISDMRVRQIQKEQTDLRRKERQG